MLSKFAKFRKFSILALIVLGAGWYGYQTLLSPKVKNNAVAPEFVPTNTPRTEVLSPTVTQTNFSKTGNLVNTDPLSSAHGPEFSLLYEEPGAPALKVELKFTSISQCNLGQGYQTCTTNSFRVGDRVKVEGFKNQSVVNIARLLYQN